MCGDVGRAPHEEMTWVDGLEPVDPSGLLAGTPAPPPPKGGFANQ